MDSIGDNVTEMDAFVRDLTMKPYAELEKRKAELHAQKLKLVQKRQQLLRDNYNVLVDYARNQDAFYQLLENSRHDFKELVLHTNQLYEPVKRSQNFLTSISEHYRDAKLMHQVQPQLSSILELPELMNACIERNYFSETLEFQALAYRLKDRFGTNSIIQELITQVETLVVKLTEKLILQLQKPLKLYSLIKVVTYLRVTAKLSEAQLKYVFLYFSWKQLQTSLRNLVPLLDYNNPELYLRRYIQVIRDRAFSLLFQYQSVFGESSNDRLNAAGTVDIPNSTSTSASPFEMDPEGFNNFGQNILSSFVRKLQLEICYVLQKFMPNVKDSTSKFSLLLQLYYCNQSLTKVGTDISIPLSKILGSEWLEMIHSQSSEKQA
ncbi:hypothetical protein POMI540_3922 [Schizosaccharomyces pombe]|uniref:Conserved oligomeric Golgi complex subunit 8 n=1 Tax=Schizosaccharomyces pombe (strain 972 / ATCC 24843) TaxID=284812 RepID=COG8_SCHPO|nr:putative COG complex subunit Cog8 [Schizosaccharomyces pombe]Q96WW5.2 RecName: Full=Conserved oligomeric Golgi complex subunit 8; Short=COG complex subunit 8; AltName: Full=Component of oligomeric Golgi complex 8 [Schizosaccharomyces pombe 972h-]BAA21385.2 pi008 [Schizosaccharomyces pombe]CAC37507.2 Golgi transport complex subunit Cog8 (predicted) [Schizosaccharomyces pombe]|eukprot:NP_595623.2 putative COG complex subunit Cog8 [Schizosaccharomyces pombe]